MDYINFKTKIKSTRPVKHYMLTYQNTSMSKEDFIKRFRIYLYPVGKGLDAYKVVQETHQNGNKHLHIIIKCCTGANGFCRCNSR